jgi:putative ABC transport system permease protein
MLFKLAARSLTRHRRRSALTIGAIAAGTAVVIFAWGFGEGIVGWMTRTAQNARLGALQVHAPGYFDVKEADPLKSAFSVDDDLRARLRSTPGVAAITERLLFAGLITTGARSSMVQVEALDPITEPTVCPDRFAAVPGGAMALSKARSVVLGGELAKSLGVKVGDSVTVATATAGGAQNALDFTVSAVTAGAGFLESKRVITMGIADGRELTNTEGRAVEIAVALRPDGGGVASDRLVEDVGVHVQQAVGTAFEVSNWQTLSPFMRDMVGRIRIVLRGVSTVLFIVVVFGIANTMLMSIYERVREIGTMLALGMKRRRIMQLFLLEATILAGSGAIAGTFVGSVVVVMLAQRGIDFTPPGSTTQALVVPVWSWSLVLIVIAAAVAGAVAATALPARRASHLAPTEALRAT